MDFVRRRVPLDKNDTLILCCASVRRHLDAAQQKIGTDFPVRELAWENPRSLR